MQPCRRVAGESNMDTSRRDLGLVLALAALVLVLAVISLMSGPASISPRQALAGLFDGQGAEGIIVRDIRLPRTLLAMLIGATFGLSGAALQGLLRNPLAEPALFGAPQAASVGASFLIAYGLAGATSFAVPIAGIAGALVSVGGLVAIAGRRASLTVTLLAGSGVRELRRCRHRADPQSRADALCRARGRVLAARLAGRPQRRSPAHRRAVPAGELGPAGAQRARLPCAHARRGRRRVARRRSQPHPHDGGDRRGVGRRRGGCGRGLDRLHRTGGAASGAALRSAPIRRACACRPR